MLRLKELKKLADYLKEIPINIVDWKKDWQSIHLDPPPLYHYTDANGLIGIIRSGHLWATHVYYVNDTQEFRYARKVILDVFGIRIEQSSSAIADKLERCKDLYSTHGILWQSLQSSFIVCFCENGNLLSQWRAYADNGQGFAIRFDPKRLIEVVQSDGRLGPTSKLFRVIYSRAKQAEHVNAAIDSLLEAFNSYESQAVFNSVPYVFSEMAFSFKNEAFAEEAEWRLACSPSAPDLLDIRQSNGRLVPYITIPISHPDGKPPYGEVRHGPTLEAENAKNAVRMLLGKAHKAYWDKVVVSGSEAPLRLR